MPVVEIHLPEGYDDDAKRRLLRALTDAVRLVVPAPPEAVTTIAHETPAANYMRGGEGRAAAAALADPAEIVRGYLSAMEARDLDAARTFLAEGFEMRFPGAAPMKTLEELVAWSKPRYRFVKKTYDGFDTAPGAPAVVVCRGTLAGEWPDGAPFEGVRFVDRFEVADGRIVRQEVWNDLALVRPKIDAGIGA
ncbi:MAG: tautomerase family protein [Pseudomonadota bacterium]